MRELDEEQKSGSRYLPNVSEYVIQWFNKRIKFPTQDILRETGDFFPEKDQINYQLRFFALNSKIVEMLHSKCYINWNQLKQCVYKYMLFILPGKTHLRNSYNNTVDKQRQYFLAATIGLAKQLTDWPTK